VVPASLGLVPGTAGHGEAKQRPPRKTAGAGIFRLSPAHLHKQRGGEQACLFLLF